MAVYRPTYIDPKTGEKKRVRVWWYNFMFAGRHVQESSKSTRKTLAQEAEKKRRRELEQKYNGVQDTRRERVKTISQIADQYLEAYKLRHRSYTFAEYALGHVTRVVGRLLAADISDHAVKDYQTARLKEKASPKSINEEVSFLLRILEEQGDAIRAKMRRLKTLKLKTTSSVARAFSPEEKIGLIAAAKARRSPSVYPALMLALHCGMRDKEIRELQWERLDLQRAIVTVGDSKTDAGQGRTIPLNADVLAALVAHAKWFLEKFGETHPEWFVFPFGKPQPTNPERHCTSFKTAWGLILRDAGVKGRWHDNRHTFITDLAESGNASDETIRDIAGHVSPQMLKHYSHIRMNAKRNAVDALVVKKPIPTTLTKESTKVELPN